MPLAAIIGGGTSLLGGIIGGIGASAASEQQAAAAEQAQTDIEQGLSQGEGQLTQAQSNVSSNLSPYTNLGLGATSQLSNLLTATPGPTSGGFQTGTGGLLEGWNQEFQPPTTAQLTDPNNPNYDAYKFTMQQGQQALNNSAAANGSLFSGATSKALSQFNQNNASQYGQQQYNNALQQYQQAYNQFNTNQANTYGRLTGVAGMGQQAATSLSGLQAGLAGNYANLALGGAQALGNTAEGIGAAQASGTVGLANSISGGISNAGQTALLASLLGQQQPNNSSTYVNPGYGVTGGYATTPLAGTLSPQSSPIPYGLTAP